MRVLEPFFNNNYDESYTRLKNRTKEILAQQVNFKSYLLCSILCYPLSSTLTRQRSTLYLNSVPSYLTIFYCILLYSTLLYSALLYSTLLYSLAITHPL